MTKHGWKSQFANDPSRDYALYLELVEGKTPQGRIELGEDGELWLCLFDCPDVKLPFSWLLSQAERAESLRVARHEDGGEV